MAEITPVHCEEYEITDKRTRIVIAEAPGRILFLGGHSQLGEGIILGTSINKTVQVALSSRDDGALRFYTTQTTERKRSNTTAIRFRKEDRWANHIKTAIYVFAEMGYSICGMNWTISGDIPQNTGLASAQAMESAAAFALKRFFNCKITEKELLRRLSAMHKVFYPGEDKTGDFLVIFNAKKDHIVLGDESTFTAVTEKLPLPAYTFLIIDSKVPFIGTQDELRIRRETLERGLKILCTKHKAQTFKDFIGANTLEIMEELDENVRRRSMHVINELRRIKESWEGIREGDLEVFAKDIFSSHRSLRDFYEVTCPETDWLVKRASETEGVFAARMTGTGFGGCVFVMVKNENKDEYIQKMEDYERIFGFHPVFYEIKAGGSVKLIAK